MQLQGVLGIVEGDDAVGERQIQQGKQSGGLRSGEPMLRSGGLRDLVPVVLNRPILKTSS
jgi:hypothetical protein